MSRSNYSDELDQWALIRWRGAVRSAIRGIRGQKLLREMLDALAYELEQDGEYCTLGVLGKARALAMAGLDPEDYESVASAFGIAGALVCEIAFENDECWYDECKAGRWQRMRAWVLANLETK